MEFGSETGGVGREDWVRASDAEREAAAERLRRDHGDGRLNDDELEQRLGAAYRARTHGELRRLFADLPGHASPAARWDGGPPARRGRRAPWFAFVVGALVLWAMVGAVLGSLFGSLFGGPPWHHGPYGHPPAFLFVVAAFVVWRVAVRRRRRRAHP